MQKGNWRILNQAEKKEKLEVLDNKKTLRELGIGRFAKLQLGNL